MSNLRTGKYGAYYGSYTGESSPLTQSEMEVNATYIYSYLIANGWKINAIAGLLGNLQAESTINAGRWQSDNVGSISSGYGLVQWTPSTNYTDWCVEQGYSDPSEMDNNLSRILYELKNNKQWIATNSYNISFLEFSISDLPVADLAKAFLLNYERPADQSVAVQSYRASLAESWYTYLTGVTPSNPTPAKKKKRYNFILQSARKRRDLWIK